jgi:hypothetical protein
VKKTGIFQALDDFLREGGRHAHVGVASRCLVAEGYLLLLHRDGFLKFQKLLIRNFMGIQLQHPLGLVFYFAKILTV